MNNRAMFPAPKNSAVKIQLLKGAGHLCTTVVVKFFLEG